MALFAINTELCSEAVILTLYPMAVVTGGRSRLDLSVLVALGTRHSEMAAFKRENSCLVKRPRGIVERCTHSVTGGTVVAEVTPVAVLVARHAGSIESGVAGRLTLAGGEGPIRFLVTLAALQVAVTAREEALIALVQMVRHGK